MAGYRYRQIDTAGGVIGIVTYDEPEIALDSTVALPDGTTGTVVDIYDDEEHGREGGVQATLVLEEGAVT